MEEIARVYVCVYIHTYTCNSENRTNLTLYIVSSLFPASAAVLISLFNYKKVSLVISMFPQMCVCMYACMYVYVYV